MVDAGIPNSQNSTTAPAQGRQYTPSPATFNGRLSEAQSNQDSDQTNVEIRAEIRARHQDNRPVQIEGRVTRIDHQRGEVTVQTRENQSVTITLDARPDTRNDAATLSTNQNVTVTIPPPQSGASETPVIITPHTPVNNAQSPTPRPSETPVEIIVERPSIITQSTAALSNTSAISAPPTLHHAPTRDAPLPTTLYPIDPVVLQHLNTQGDIAPPPITTRTQLTPALNLSVVENGATSIQVATQALTSLPAPISPHVLPHVLPHDLTAFPALASDQAVPTLNTINLSAPKASIDKITDVIRSLTAPNQGAQFNTTLPATLPVSFTTTIINASSPLTVQNFTAPFAPPIFSQPQSTNILNITAPSIQNEITAPAPDIRAGEVSASIIAKTSQGAPVISIDSTAASNAPPTSASAALGINGVAAAPPLFALSAPLPHSIVGSTLTLSPIYAAPPQGSIAAPINTDPAAATSSGAALPIITPPFAAPFAPWPLLQDVMDTLHQQALSQSAQGAAAKAAITTITNATPNLNNPAQFGAAALFFISAIRGGGDLGTWLGEKTLETLRATGKGDLLTRLTNDPLTNARDGAQSTSAEWRSLQIPLMMDHKIHAFTLRMKDDDQGNDNKDKKQNNGTRFVFDLTYDAIGALQLDGFYKPQTKESNQESNQESQNTQMARLDVILRSQQSFSVSMHAAMRRIYANALRETNITGELSFQSGQSSLNQWVMVDTKDDVNIGVDI